MAVPVLGVLGRGGVLPVMTAKGTDSASRLKLAAGRWENGEPPGRRIVGVGDAAYAGKEEANPPENVTWIRAARIPAPRVP